MNKIGIHYGSFMTDWTDDQFPLIAKAKNLGFDVLELGAGYLLNQNDSGLKRLKDEAEKQDIKLLASIGLAVEENISSDNREHRTAGITLLKRLPITMSKAGISDCSGVVVTGWKAKISSFEQKAGRWKHSIASMKEVIKVFESKGVFLNTEVTHRFENYLTNTCDEGLRYIDEVGSPNLGLHLDTFHMNIEEDSFTDAIIKGAPKLRFFHIGENNRKMPGFGMLPWKLIFDTLKNSGYKGPVSMEPFVRSGGPVGNTVSLWREIMDTSDYENDLKRSLTFVKSLLK